MRTLEGYVCIVTGATRGVGRTLAIGLGEAGATVYITGRTLDSTRNKLNQQCFCLKETAKEIEARGGKAIPVAVDHSDDTQVVGLFNRVRREQGGHLDVLINNAFSACDYLLEDASADRVYWESSAAVRDPNEEWDLVNRVGLRNSYTCCVLATRMMVDCRSEATIETVGPATANGKHYNVHGEKSKRPTGIIINVSSLGGTLRLFNVAFCAGKSALDRMSMEMSRDLLSRGVNVVVFSLLPGLVKTESVIAALNSGRAPPMLVNAVNAGLGVSLELPGRLVASMVKQPRCALLKQSGRSLFLADLARNFGLKDSDNKYPTHPRSIKTLLKLAGWKRLAFFVPSFVKLPCWVLSLATSKF